MRLLTPPSTLSQQQRTGWVLVAIGVALAAGFTALNITDGEAWTRLLPVFLVAGLMAAAGAWQVVAARRGRLRFDEQRRHRHYRAGYRAFVLIALALIVTAALEPVPGPTPASYLLFGMGVFVASLAVDRHRG
ncbi:hypothetical protein G6M89_17605 [Natronolimnobius sp. AArcel1]|uniref:hypothetical protein n=1 Tax=Natronolimnobius sp. AArcel1 TaxID=1679093 RepID=UPI0013EB4974|nr:hypothetical protein [Natronolimnobius sp. AArcel1]NGM70794.1 hypothetical protein [Natronolimnobius sp. AArcel1]